MGDDYDDGNTTLNIMIDVNRKRYVTWHNTVTVNSVKGNQNNFFFFQAFPLVGVAVVDEPSPRISVVGHLWT